MKLSIEKRAGRAFAKLEDMGCPVFWGGWSGGHFRISGEDNYHRFTREPMLWADYWEGSNYPATCDDFGVAHKVNKVLDHYNLRAEWCNSGVLDVYDNT